MEEHILEIQEKEAHHMQRMEKLQRIRTVMIVLPIFISIILFTASEILADLTYFKAYFFQLFGFGMLLGSAVVVLMTYLQTGFKKSAIKELDYAKYEKELFSLRNKIEHNSFTSFPDLEIVKEEIVDLRELITQNNSKNTAITTEERDELVSLLREEIVKRSINEASEDVLKQLEEKVKTTTHLNDVESIFQKTLKRIYAEIDALSRRGNLNLTLGILTTIVGLAILGYFVVEIDSIPEDKLAFIAHFIPRLSLVLLIEVFAYFFLRLYKSSLSEIKYFQNEMTNIEAKLVAIKCSIITSDAKATSAVILELSKTERNAILEKGQTTAEIERSKIEQQNISTITNKVSNLLGSDNT